MNILTLKMTLRNKGISLYWRYRFRPPFPASAREIKIGKGSDVLFKNLTLLFNPLAYKKIIYICVFEIPFLLL